MFRYVMKMCIDFVPLLFVLSVLKVFISGLLSVLFLSLNSGICIIWNAKYNKIVFDVLWTSSGRLCPLAFMIYLCTASSRSSSCSVRVRLRSGSNFELLKILSLSLIHRATVLFGTPYSFTICVLDFTPLTISCIDLYLVSSE